MRKLAILLTITALIFTGCKERQEDKKHLIVGMCVGYPPYEITGKTGKIVGLDVDVVKVIAKKLNREIIFKDVKFNDLIDSLLSKHIDIIISAMVITDERLEKMNMIHYQGEEIKNYYLAFWLGIPEGIKSIDDFKDRPDLNITTQWGTNQEAFLMSQKGVNARSFKDYIAPILEVKNGRATATILEPDLMNVLKTEFPNLKFLKLSIDEKFWSNGYGIGLRKDDEELYSEISKIVQDLKNNNTISKIEKRWYSKYIRKEL